LGSNTHLITDTRIEAFFPDKYKSINNITLTADKFLYFYADEVVGAEQSTITNKVSLIGTPISSMMYCSELAA
jgi:hypothetical protein